MASLFVVATPIGNLEDLSPRAQRVLSQCPVIAAESLKRTKKLLSHLGLGGKRLVSCRESNRDQAARKVAEALEAGKDVALVSDAGTPGVSDPAQAVVELAAKRGFKVSPIPGPSALAAALSVSGMDVTPSVFLGFMPAKSGPRVKLLKTAAATGWPLVIYEAPHRLAACVRDILDVLGDREVLLAREVSKLHEEIARTTLAGLAARSGDWEARGEITLVIAGGEAGAAVRGQKGEAGMADEMDAFLAEESAKGQEPPSRLAKIAAKKFGVARDEAYRRLQRLKARS